MDFACLVMKETRKFENCHYEESLRVVPVISLLASKNPPSLSDDIKLGFDFILSDICHQSLYRWTQCLTSAFDVETNSEECKRHCSHRIQPSPHQHVGHESMSNQCQTAYPTGDFGE